MPVSEPACVHARKLCAELWSVRPNTCSSSPGAAVSSPGAAVSAADTWADTFTGLFRYKFKLWVLGWSW